jgi:colicin import membrane protein
MPELQNYISELMVRVDKDFDNWAQKERARAAVVKAEQEAERKAREEAEARAADEAEKRRLTEEAEAEAERLRVESEEKEKLRAETGGKYVPRALRAALGAGGGGVGNVMPPSRGPASMGAGSAMSNGSDARGPNRYPGRSATGAQTSDARAAAFSSFGNRTRDTPGSERSTSGAAGAGESRRPRIINSKLNPPAGK